MDEGYTVEHFKKCHSYREQREAEGFFGPFMGYFYPWNEELK
jgi:hypothetical protein